MLVYLITNKVNGKQYVGQTLENLQRRWTRHCWSAQSPKQRHYKISRAITKYGPESFMIEPIHVCETKEEMSFVEMFYIALLNTEKAGYNITSGGEGATGYKHTPASKIKMSVAQLGNQNSVGHVRSPFAIQRVREVWTGRKHTPETKAKMRTAALLRCRERNEKGQYLGATQ